MTGLKGWLQDFPSHNGSVVAALTLILLTGFVVLVKLAIGHIFPDGYDTWIWMLAALAGINVGGMIGKRATDTEYVTAKASQVKVENAEKIETSPAPTQPVVTRGPGKTDPAIVAVLESAAAGKLQNAPHVADD